MIVEHDYYSSEYGGICTDDDFSRYSLRAEAVISHITRGRISNLDALHVSLQNAVRTAICAQIEYFVLNGIETSVAGDTGDSFRVGNVSVSGNQKTSSVRFPAVCPGAYAALETTGLLYAGVGVC